MQQYRSQSLLQLGKLSPAQPFPRAAVVAEFLGVLPIFNILQPSGREREYPPRQIIRQVGEHVLPDLERGQQIRDYRRGEVRDLIESPIAKPAPG
jgi:hypothetical protein